MVFPEHSVVIGSYSYCFRITLFTNLSVNSVHVFFLF